MHASQFGLSQHQQFPQYLPAPHPHQQLDPSQHQQGQGQQQQGQPGMADPAQIQQLVQLLGAKMLPKQTAVVECPKSMVGRVIGKGGETIKSLQQYTGAMIQIDQSTDPTRVTIAGSPQSLQLAVSMVNDIVRGTFKGFAMLRQIALATTQPGMPGYGQPQPVYVQGYGFVPPSQVYNPDDPLAAAQMLRSSPPTGPLTPPMTPLRATAANNLAGGLTPEALAALLGQQQQQQGGMGGMPGMGMGGAGAGSQDQLLGQLLGQLAGQQQQHQAPTMNLQQHQQQMQQMAAHQQHQQHQQQQAGPSDLHGGGGGNPLAGADQATIQALLAQAGLLGGNHSLASASAPGMQGSSGLMLGAGGAPAMASSAAGTLSTLSATSSPTQSMSVPAASPGGAAASRAFSGLGQAPANTAGSFLGTSPTATHSSGGEIGSGRTSPAAALTAAANPSLVTRRPGSDTGSPLGRYGAVDSPSSQGGPLSIGAAAEEALSAQLSAITTRDLGEGGNGGGMLPPGWAKVTDGQGLVYYINHVTQESSLTRPTAQSQTAM